MFPASFSHGTVINIAASSIDGYLRSRMQSSLLEAKAKGEIPYLPENLVYLKNGLHIWSQLVHHLKYYQIHDEISLFRKNGEEIANYVAPNSTLIDLGSGDTRKVETLLSVLEVRNQEATYLALDISRSYLESDLAIFAPQHSSVLFQGVFGTYSDAVSWCIKPPSPRVFLWLGSVLFRGAPEDVLVMLQSWAAILRLEDMIFAGVDDYQAPEYDDKIWESYHADEALWQKLWDNGFGVANEVIGEEWFRSEDWRLDAGVEMESICQHRFRFRAERDVILGNSGLAFRKGDELGWLDAHKFSISEVQGLCERVGLDVVKA